MSRHIQKLFISLLLGVLDIAAFCACSVLATLLMEPESLSLSMLLPFWVNSTMLILITYLSGQMYSFKNHIFWDEFRSITKLALYCLVMALLFKLWFPGSLRIRTFLASYALFIGVEIFLRYFFRRIPPIASILVTSVMVIGCKRRARRMIYRIKASKFSLYQPCYAVAEHKVPQNPCVLGVPVIGSLENLSQLLEDHPVDELLVALAEYDSSQVNRIISTAIHHVKRVQYLPDARYLINYSSSIKELNGIMVLSTEFLSPGVFSRILKRLVDIAAGVFGLIMLIPLTLVIGVCMLFFDRGPIFYSQIRIGLHGKPFRIWKFRSMVKNADAKLQQVLAANPALRAKYEKHRKLENDPRITGVGRFLRKTSLDELPQAVNLLRGNMSLVGPRPYLPNEKKLMNSHYDVIVKVKPGITGLWQVNGRSDLSFDDRLVLDEYYIHNHSWWNDCIIILKTIRVVLFRLGAV